LLTLSGKTDISHMQLLPEEKVLVSSNEDKVVLTNHRIHQSNKEWGRSYQVTIFLENISSVELLYLSNPLYSILAAICFLIGFFVTANDRSIDTGVQSGSFFLGVIFIILWWSTKHRVVTIASNGGAKLKFRVDGMQTADVQQFIHKVQEAKVNRTKCFIGV